METTPKSTIENNSKNRENKNFNENATVAGTKVQNKEEKPKKPRRRDKSDLGENFIAPDGGVWAWLVCIAAGLSNLSVYPCSQQFGFLFRERLINLGLSTSEVTTLINTNPAISSCSGLLNGPMFRRFSYRQVAIAGSLLVFTGITISAYCETFWGYLIFFSILYGFGTGISVSASALAINTYFNQRRRRATGFSWTITGLGPIFLPHLVIYLLSIYEVEETVLIFAAFSLHSMVSAMIYQPAQYHARTTPTDPYTQPKDLETIPKINICEFCQLYQNENHMEKPCYEIVGPTTPMLSRANDGWYGSKLSLASHASSARLRTIASAKDLENGFNLEAGEFLKPNHLKRAHDEAMKRSSSRLAVEKGHHMQSNKSLRCTCAEESVLMELQSNANADEEPEKLSFLRKVVVFFDLDLLRDFTYVNLVVGLTTINFGEMNFSLLTPFILADYGFTSQQMTTATSILASMDLLMRFIVPFLTENIKWDNRVFFLIGVLGIACARTVVACTRSYYVVLGSFFVIGIFKGIRTVFWPLIIPSYVPLKRLPAASGLQLLITGLFTLAGGPFVGMVRDHYNYSVTIHCLNCGTFFAASSWTVEYLLRRCANGGFRKE